APSPPPRASGVGTTERSMVLAKLLPVAFAVIELLSTVADTAEAAPVASEVVSASAIDALAAPAFSCAAVMMACAFTVAVATGGGVPFGVTAVSPACASVATIVIAIAVP